MIRYLLVIPEIPVIIFWRTISSIVEWEDLRNICLST